jgi:hypothetical protein
MVNILHVQVITFTYFVEHILTFTLAQHLCVIFLKHIYMMPCIYIYIYCNVSVNNNIISSLLYKTIIFNDLEKCSILILLQILNFKAINHT